MAPKPDDGTVTEAGTAVEFKYGTEDPIAPEDPGENPLEERPVKSEVFPVPTVDPEAPPSSTISVYRNQIICRY